MAGTIINVANGIQAAANDVAERYQDFKQNSNYTRDEGLLVLPSTQPGSPPKIIRVHEPVGFVTKQFTAIKNGTPPVVPAPMNTEQGDVILSSEFEVFLPQSLPNQDGWMFRSDGSYSYVQGNIRGSAGGVARNTYQSGDYPFDFQLIDLGRRGIIGGVLGAVNGSDPLSPTYNQYQTFYPAFFFSPELSSE